MNIRGLNAGNLLMRSCTSDTRNWTVDRDAAGVPPRSHRLVAPCMCRLHRRGKKWHWFASCVRFPDAVIEKWIVLVKACSDCRPYRDTAEGRAKIYSPLCPFFWAWERCTGWPWGGQSSTSERHIHSSSKTQNIFDWWILFGIFKPVERNKELNGF